MLNYFARTAPVTLIALLLTATSACTTEVDTDTVGTTHSAMTSQDAGAILDLDGIQLDDEACDCAEAFLKNLRQKLVEARRLWDTAKGSVTETTGYMETINEDIISERAALNEVVASDTSLYTGIAVDSIALALDVANPASGLARRAVCKAGKKLGETMVKRALTTVAKRMQVGPLKNGRRRVALARVVEGQNNGITEATTWIPVIGPMLEISAKWGALRKRDELMAARKENLNALVAEYDKTTAILTDLMAKASAFEAEIANLESQIASFDRSRALCEVFVDDPGALGELGIDPEWPPGWADVFHVAVKPKPVVCQSAWLKFTGSSRLSRFFGSRDAVNAAKAHAEAMCFNNPIGSVPNPTCEAGTTQQRTVFYDMQGEQNPGGDRHGAGCGAPRFYGSSTVWSEPLTEVDCWCFRTTCCGQGLDGAGAGSAAQVAE